LSSRKDPRLLPGECRHLRLTYKAPVYATLVFNIDGVGPVEVDRKLGNVPLMVKTRHCHRKSLTKEPM
jgi:DNA-directed RNA polymerase I subunit RPA2